LPSPPFFSFLSLLSSCPLSFPSFLMGWEKSLLLCVLMGVTQERGFEMVGMAGGWWPRGTSPWSGAWAVSPQYQGRRPSGNQETGRMGRWTHYLLIAFPCEKEMGGRLGEGAVVLRERGRTTVSSNRGGWGNVRRQQCQDSLKMDDRSHWWGQFVQVGTFSSTWRCTGTGEAWQRAWGFAWLTWP
jgi:hypothetical protein